MSCTVSKTWLIGAASLVLVGVLSVGLAAPPAASNAMDDMLGFWVLRDKDRIGSHQLVCDLDAFGKVVVEQGVLEIYGHTNVGGATMFPSVASCNNGPATTAADDQAGIVALYGGGGGGGPNSCVGNCGSQAPGGCWCDRFCVFFGDCCTDKVAVCG